MLGQKAKRYWLFQACHVTGIRRSTFYAVSGYTGVKHHLLIVHKTDGDSKKLVETPKHHSLFEMWGLQLGNRDLSKYQQDIFADAFPDLVTQQNPAFYQTILPETIAIFQLLTGATSLFCTFYTGLSTVICSRYMMRLTEIQQLITTALSKVQIALIFGP